MRQERWRAILAARDDVDKLVAAAVGDFPRQAPARATTAIPAPPRGPATPRATTATPSAVAPQETTRMWREPTQLATATAPAPAPSVEQEVLQRLHQDVLARIEILRAALAPEPGGEQAMLALVLYFDERVMGQLPEYLATSWPLLQTRLTGRKTGGSDFFRLIDRLLDGEPPPAFVLEVYYYCLTSGFQGQYADDPAALESYRQRLRARITAPEPEQQPREQAATPSPAPMRSPALYYAAAALAVFLTAVVLTAWSNG
jgi:type IV/VI secretion system ImpK/VasF family protein